MIKLPANAALIIVDVQEGFNDPRWGSRNNLNAESNVSRLLEAWRKTGQPIFHINHDSVSPNKAFYPGTPGNAPKREALPCSGEPVYRKNVNSAFIGTALEADLRAAGVDTVVVVGLTAQHCVSTTARMAGNLGFKTYVVSDATAAFEQVGIDGRKRPAVEVHYGALSDLQREFATIVDTASILDVTVPAAEHDLKTAVSPNNSAG
jgi:nicotinamidase-related amidase